jgi:hypothetical protein
MRRHWRTGLTHFRNRYRLATESHVTTTCTPASSMSGPDEPSLPTGLRSGSDERTEP